MLEYLSDNNKIIKQEIFPKIYCFYWKLGVGSKLHKKKRMGFNKILNKFPL